MEVPCALRGVVVIKKLRFSDGVRSTIVFFVAGLSMRVRARLDPDSRQTNRPNRPCSGTKSAKFSAVPSNLDTR